MGDFNMTTTNNLLIELIDNLNVSILINNPACFKDTVRSLSVVSNNPEFLQN